MVGNVLLSSAFLTYIGFFDHLYRKSLMINWKTILESEGLKFRQNLELIEFLSTPIEKHQWKICGLPQDELCIENAIILSHFERCTPFLLTPQRPPNNRPRKSGD